MKKLSDKTDHVRLDLIIGSPDEKRGDATGAGAVVIEEIVAQYLDGLLCLGLLEHFPDDRRGHPTPPG